MRRERGTALTEAQQLEIGDYQVWDDEDNYRMLTTWPRPADFVGEEVAVHCDDGDVVGPWPLPEGAPLADRVFWARTLTDEESAGLCAADEREIEHRAVRQELYRRAAFGLASPAELASLVAANGGKVGHWADGMRGLSAAPAA